MVWVLVREGVVIVTTHFFFAHSGETIIWDFGEFGWKNESGQGRLGGGRNLGDRSGTDHPHFYNYIVTRIRYSLPTSTHMPVQP